MTSDNWFAARNGAGFWEVTHHKATNSLRKRVAQPEVRLGPKIVSGYDLGAFGSNPCHLISIHYQMMLPCHGKGHHSELAAILITSAASQMMRGIS